MAEGVSTPQVSGPSKLQQERVGARPSSALASAPWRISAANGVVVEFFAGEGDLSAAVLKMGIRTDPDDLSSGGIDFCVDTALEDAKAKLRQLTARGEKLMVHLAPPCATFFASRR